MYIIRIKIKDDHILLLTIYAIDAQDKLTVNVQIVYTNVCSFSKKIFGKEDLNREFFCNLQDVNSMA